MAALVKNIEREFLLTTAMREGASITVNAGGGEWTVKILAVTAGALTIAHGIPLSLLRKNMPYSFHYNVRGQNIAFKTTILEPGEKSLTLAMPERVYKNLSRRYARLPPPSDLSASFSFAGERYDLDFPSSAGFNPAKEPEPSPDFDPTDLKGLMAEFE